MIRAIGIFSVLVLLSSCSHEHDVVKKPAPFTELNPVPMDITATPYHIGAGDKLELKFFFMPDLNETVQVRPDGRISVMFIGDVRAAGRTPEQLEKIIRKRLQHHVKQTDMIVSVSSFGSQRVYVGGEVIHPGPVQLQGRSDLTQVLGEAGWLTPLASQQEIVILRRGKDNKESVYHVSSGKIISGEDTGQDVLVQAGDVILVPPSGSVDFDRWMDQNVRLALPFNMGASYIYSNTSNSAELLR